MTNAETSVAASVAAGRPLRALYAGNARSVMQRGWRATKSSNWMIVVSGFFEPIFYLLSMGLGLGALIFWLYYRNYLMGTEHILPTAWRNGLMH